MKGKNPVKQQVVLSLILAGSLVAVGANAQETTTETNTKTSTVQATDMKKSEESRKDIDEEITNARMRATLGSKSKWSFKSALGYSGGSVEKPLAETRPNYRAGADREALPGLSGTVGVNFRATDKDSFSLNTGINIVDPLHGDITKNATDTRGGGAESTPRYEVSTPSLGWSRGYKAMNAQMISSVSLSKYTDKDSSDSQAWGDVYLSQTILADFGKTNWSGGVSLAGAISLYGEGAISNTVMVSPTLNLRQAHEAGLIKRSDFLLAVYPFAEYTFNDTFSFRTVFGYFEFMNYRSEFGNSTDFFQREPYQSVGIGISVTRDIYLYPNVQFTPKDVRADRTNVALSTNINLF